MKIYIAGIDGMIGSACEKLFNTKYEVIGTTFSDLNLLDYNAVYEYLEQQKPDLVLMAAAKVGGGYAIQSQPVEFLEENIQIQMNLMKAANILNINKFIFIASAAIYPADVPNPISESMLMQGALDKVQESYGLAKLVGYYQTQYYNNQYGRQYITVIPANVIGNRDNGQVAYSLIKQMNNAKKNHIPSITLWGSGNQRREFIFVEDVAKALYTIIENFDKLAHSVYNLGVQNDISIKELAYMIKDITKYNGELIFDLTKPEGVYQRVLNSEKIYELGFNPSIELEKGLKDINRSVANNFEIKNMVEISKNKVS